MHLEFKIANKIKQDGSNVVASLGVQVLCNCGVEAAQRIIHQVDVGVCIQRTGQVDSGLLAATQIDAFFANHCVFAIRKSCDIL